MSRRAVIGLFSAALFLAPAAARPQQPCSPVATLTGEPALVVHVAHELGQRGIDTRPNSECPEVRVHLSGADGYLLVAIRDASGRASERIVARPESAATIIESWVRSDLTRDLLAANGGVSLLVSTAPLPPAMPEPPGAVERIAGAAPPAMATRRPILTFSLQGEATRASNASLSLGAAGFACMRLGPACAGVLGRVSSAARLPTEGTGLAADRLGIDLLLAAELPLRIGRFTLAPGMTLGLGFSRTTATLAGAQSSEQQLSVSTGGLRGGGQLVLSLPIAWRVALELGLGLDLAIQAHTDAFPVDDCQLVAPQGRGPGPHGGTHGGMNPGETRDMTCVRVGTVAGEPRALVRGGIGLRYDLP